MNLFKKLAEAIFGKRKRKKVNLNKINDAPPPGSKEPVNISRFRGSRWQGHKGQTAAQKYEADRNRWKNGGTGSWSRSHAKKSDSYA